MVLQVSGSQETLRGAIQWHWYLGFLADCSQVYTRGQTGSDDVGESYIPAPAGSEPPRYEQLEWGDAPAYESPVSPITDDDRAASPNLDPFIRRQSAPSPTVEQPGSQQSSGLTRVPSRAPRLPAFESLPSINVEGATEPNTPASTTGQWHDVHDN